VSISWARIDILDLPSMGQHRGGDDFEALAAISRFTQVLAFDRSGELVWPMGQAILQDFSAAMPAEHPHVVMDRVAEDLWLNNSEIMVQCAGDIDSVAALAAVCKKATDLSKVTVRYTKSGPERYPKLFSTILPALGVVMENRDNKHLVGDLTMAYVDGRTGGDWQASYLDSTLERHRVLIEEGTLEDMIELVSTSFSSTTEKVSAAKRGIQRFIDASPINITSPWSLVVALYRLCASQTNSLNGVMIEDNTENAFNSRRSFFDLPTFNSASQYIADVGIPAENEGALEMRQYCLDYFGDQEWFDTNRPGGNYFIYSLGKFNTHWLDGEGVAHTYDKLPMLVKNITVRDNRPATWIQIRDWREKHKRAPVDTSMGSFDVDDAADQNFRGMIGEFDNLPTLQAGKLTWKRADNSFIPLTKTELQQVYAEIKTARATRGALLHVSAEMFQQMATPPTPAQLANLSFWLAQ